MAGNAPAKAEEPGYFTKGTWTITGYGSYLKSFTGQQAQIGAGTVGVGYYVFDNLAMNVEAGGYYNSQPGTDARITAADLLVRQHVLQSGRFSFFLDGVAGITYADHRTPAIGTNYNNILEAGIGATFQIHENLHVIGGARYFHLSNARLEGPLRNPGINATHGYIGLMWKF